MLAFMAAVAAIPIQAIEKEPLAEYASRRARVAEQIKGGALIIFGAPDSDLTKFKQEDSFYYLTGFNEPDAVLLMDTSGDEVEETLFIPPPMVFWICCISSMILAAVPGLLPIGNSC